jgi:hypothetical protein
MFYRLPKSFGQMVLSKTDLNHAPLHGVRIDYSLQRMLQPLPFNMVILQVHDFFSVGLKRLSPQSDESSRYPIMYTLTG